jgi:hypothetical protein
MKRRKSPDALINKKEKQIFYYNPRQSIKHVKKMKNEGRKN